MRASSQLKFSFCICRLQRLLCRMYAEHFFCAEKRNPSASPSHGSIHLPRLGILSISRLRLQDSQDASCTNLTQLQFRLRHYNTHCKDLSQGPLVYHDLLQGPQSRHPFDLKKFPLGTTRAYGKETQSQGQRQAPLMGSRTCVLPCLPHHRSRSCCRDPFLPRSQTP